MRPPAARWTDRVPEQWNALIAADPGASPSHRPELWTAFIAAQPGLSLRVIVVEEHGSLIGGAPVLVERRGGMCWLRALPMLLAGAPIALPGRHGEVDAAVADALAGLAAETGAVGGEWALYRGAGAPVAADMLTPVTGETRWMEAAVVDLTHGIDAAHRRMDRKQRQSLRDTQARGYAFAADPAALEAAYALHIAQGRQWRGHRAQPLELSRRLLASGPAPVARLFGLRDPHGLVSAALALDGPHETFVWWSGTHPSARRPGAFPLLLWSIVEWAAGAGRSRVNLGASTGLSLVASFKSSFGATGVRYPVRWLDARHAPVTARAAAWLQGWVRRGRPRGEAA
ncbi:MAG: GNAT family N-acetyltransferase [Candidatus Eisenbacteria bacterium]